MDLYASSIYFVMQTITTVGYGDISIVTPTERIICILLQLIGVISFSFASGSLTSIIANIDIDDNKNQDKIDTLNKLFKEYKLPSDLYYQLKT